MATIGQTASSDAKADGTTDRERRRLFSREIMAAVGIRSPALLHAFATVPRERYLPPGPWIVEAIDGAYYATQDNDVSHILHAVGVALDAKRELNTANPARVGRSLEAAEFRPGDEVLHVGAGMGYFSAIIAELVGPTGRVTAAEIDEQLASKARSNLASRPNVEIIGDALTHPLPSVDVVFASAGSAIIPRPWVDALRPGGRMVLPLTGSKNIGVSLVVKKTNDNSRLAAQHREFVRYYPCIGTRDAGAIDAVDAALSDPRGPFVKSLRLDPHPPDGQCWLHGEGWCLSMAEPED